MTNGSRTRAGHPTGGTATEPRAAAGRTRGYFFGRREEALGRPGGSTSGTCGAGEYGRLTAVELMDVKGWRNRDVANLRFRAKRRLRDRLAAKLSADLFPELQG